MDGPARRAACAAAYAEATWPMIWDSPRTMESSPQTMRYRRNAASLPVKVWTESETPARRKKSTVDSNTSPDEGAKNLEAVAGGQYHDLRWPRGQEAGATLQRSAKGPPAAPRAQNDGSAQRRKPASRDSWLFNREPNHRFLESQGNRPCKGSKTAHSGTKCSAEGPPALSRP